MTQLEIGLTVITAFLFFVISVMFVVWFHQVKDLRSDNDKLNRNLTAIKASYARLKQQKEISEARSATELNRTLYLWREETDELRSMLAQKDRLLQQKWAVAKDAVSE